MATGKPHPENSDLLDYGDTHRVEKRLRPEHKITPVLEPSTGKQRVDVKTGELLTEDVIQLDKDGKEIHLWVLYEKHIVVDGKHPIHKDKHGEVLDTRMEFVWMPIKTGSEDDMKAEAEKLSK